MKCSFPPVSTRCQVASPPGKPGKQGSVAPVQEVDCQAASNKSLPFSKKVTKKKMTVKQVAKAIRKNATAAKRVAKKKITADNRAAVVLYVTGGTL